MGKKTDISPEVVKAIVKELQNLEYGSVTIVVQNSKVVQLEVNEKKRLQKKFVGGKNLN